MIRPSARLFILSVVLFGLPHPARADFFVVPFAGLKFGGSTSIVDLELAAGKRKLVLGVAALKIDDGIIGWQAEFGNIAGFFANEELAAIEPLVKPGSYVNDLTGSIVLALPPGATRGGLRPYIVAGGGLIHAEAEDYFEVPEQPWLDGFCTGSGVVRQFVAMPLGSGYTVEEQVTRTAADHPRRGGGRRSEKE